MSSKLLGNSEKLISVTVTSSLIQDWRVRGCVADQASLTVAVKWSEEYRVPSSKRKLLGVGDLA
jgi:hypothetical protein